MNMTYTIRRIANFQTDRISSKNESEAISKLISEILVDEYKLKPKQEGSVMVDQCFSHFGKHYNKESNKKNTTLKRGYFLAIDDTGELLGGCGYAEKSGEILETFEVQRMFVAKRARGLGLGSQLLDVTLKEAFARGYQQGYLDTRSDMQTAQKLYQSRGFKVDHSTDKKPVHALSADVMMYLSKEDWQQAEDARTVTRHNCSNGITAG
jgi:predicted GNAT family N-acyltransferase